MSNQDRNPILSDNLSRAQKKEFRSDMNPVMGFAPDLEKPRDIQNKDRDRQKLGEYQYAGDAIYCSRGLIGVPVAITAAAAVRIATSTYSRIVLIANAQKLVGGVDSILYVGNSGVTTTSGYPIFETQQQTFILGENVELWCIVSGNFTIKIFYL